MVSPIEVVDQLRLVRRPRRKERPARIEEVALVADIVRDERVAFAKRRPAVHRVHRFEEVAADAARARRQIFAVPCRGQVQLKASCTWSGALAMGCDRADHIAVIGIRPGGRDRGCRGDDDVGDVERRQRRNRTVRQSHRRGRRHRPHRDRTGQRH